MTDQELVTWSGTKIVLRDLALRFAERGHDPIVYSPHHGEAADRFRRLGISVVDDLDAVPGRPDIIHGQHNIPTALALATFPGVPAILFCHSVEWIDIPLRFDRIRRYLAIDRKRYDFVTRRYGIDPERCELMPNVIDLRRFPPREKPLPQPPRTALSFSKHSSHLGVLESACRSRGIAFDAIGQGVGRIVDDPERYLYESDIVFGIDRCAMEAICAGAATILVTPPRLGGMVTERRLKSLRQANFGHAALIHPLSPAAVAAEIDRYDPSDAAAATAAYRKLADLDGTVDRLEELYAEALVADLPKEWTDDDRAGLAAFLEAWPVPPHTSAWDDARRRLQDLAVLRD